MRNETKQVKEEVDRIAKAKGQICLQIVERQKKIASYESDSFTLSKVHMVDGCTPVNCSALSMNLYTIFHLF